jgi:gluconolactonase
VPEMVTNVEFGGPEMSDLFITATTSLYRVRTTTRCGRA